MDGETTTHTYNGDGLRVSKTMESGLTTRYAYEYTEVVLELDGSGNQKALNVRGHKLLARVTSAGSSWFMYNGHGDVTALTNGANTVQATYYYDAFGVHKEQTGTADNPYRYSGYTFDEESGLYYLNARFYDPELARFMQEDTYRGNSADPLSLNLYTYVSNNPLVYWDPTGHVKVGDDKLTPAAQQQIVTLTDLYYATSDPKERKKIEEQADKIRDNPANKATGNSAPSPSSSKNTIPLADATQATQIVKNALKQMTENGKTGNKSITTNQWTALTSNVSFGGVRAKSVNNVTGASVVQTTFAGTVVTTSYHKNTQAITFSTQKNTAFWTNPTIFGKQKRGEEWFTDPDLRVIAESQLLWELDKYGSIDMSVESPEKVHDYSNKVMLVQYLSGGPATGSWDGNSYNALQDHATLAGLKWVDNSVDSALMRHLVAFDAGRANWKRGDFIRKYGIADAVVNLAMATAIYQQASYRNSWGRSGATEGAGKIKTNLGNELDITPSSNHSTTTNNPGLKGTPNSSVDILDGNGNIKTRRWFGSDGFQTRDVDFTNHGNPKVHPEWPHEHGPR